MVAERGMKLLMTKLNPVGCLQPLANEARIQLECAKKSMEDFMSELEEILDVKRSVDTLIVLKETGNLLCLLIVLPGSLIRSFYVLRVEIANISAGDLIYCLLPSDTITARAYAINSSIYIRYTSCYL